MLLVLILIISSILVIFLEHFFLGILSISIFAIIGLFLWDKLKLGIYIPYILIISLILDITLNASLGTHILVLGIVLMLALLIKALVPRESFLINIVVLSFLTAIYYILYDQITSLLIYSNLTYVNINTLLKTLACIPIYAILQISSQSFRNNKFEKIRLR